MTNHKILCIFFMKAAIFEKPGLENLKVIDNAARPESSARALHR
jgi:hypothetical protein